MLNLSVYPAVADYPRSRPLGSTWHRLESSVRETEEPFEVPESLRDGDGSLVYLSLGSLGSADVELMRRLVDRARGDAAPVHRLEGPQGRRDRPAREHVGRGTAAADLDHPARATS